MVLSKLLAAGIALLLLVVLLIILSDAGSSLFQVEFPW